MMKKRYANKIVWIALLSLLAAFCLCGCGTVTTQEAQQYLDGNGDTSEQDYSKYDSADVGAYDIDESESGSDETDNNSESSNNASVVASGSASSSSDSTDQPVAVSEEEQAVNASVTHQCTILINCSTILDNMTNLDASKTGLVPGDGVILQKTTVAFYEGETVLDVLKRVTKKYSIHLEFTDSAAYSGGYIEGIANLYEKDCGKGSGWQYCVNGWYPNYGCGNYVVTDGDNIQWNYTCDLGDDL
jgi:hypothetical protein